MIIDESHQTIPQVSGMYSGDRSRKLVLVDYGFRLPRHFTTGLLIFMNLKHLLIKSYFVSATPDDYELAKAKA